MQNPCFPTAAAISPCAIWESQHSPSLIFDVKMPVETNLLTDLCLKPSHKLKCIFGPHRHTQGQPQQAYSFGGYLEVNTHCRSPTHKVFPIYWTNVSPTKDVLAFPQRKITRTVILNKFNNWGWICSELIQTICGPIAPTCLVNPPKAYFESGKTLTYLPWVFLYAENLKWFNSQPAVGNATSHLLLVFYFLQSSPYCFAVWSMPSSGSKYFLFCSAESASRYLLCFLKLLFYIHGNVN